MTKLKQYNYLSATAINLIMLLVSFSLLIVIHTIRARTLKRKQIE